MLSISKILTLTKHRGSSRFWTSGHAPERSGFEPGRKFKLSNHGNGVLLELDENGNRTVSVKVRSNGSQAAIIDINNDEDLAPLVGVEAVRVVFGEGKVFITPLASEARRQRRLSRLLHKLKEGLPLRTVGLAAGGGVLSHAVHAGLHDAGLKPELHAHNEIREDLCDHALENNDIVTPKTQILNMPLQELAFDDAVLKLVGECDVLDLGLPCSGASVAGRAKRRLEMPEEHPDVGHLVVGALCLIAKLNPAVVIFENVPPYGRSASAALIRQQLRDLGYETHERMLFGPDFGALEARERWSLTAVTRGIPFDLSTLDVPGPSGQTVGDLLDPPEKVESRWSEMKGLKDKQVRDLEAGKGFRMQVYTGSESTINTLTKGIAKNRSTDPKIQHPTNPDLLRVPTAEEHARYKGVPLQLISNLSQTIAHELLGQGIIYNTFRCLAKHVGLELKKWVSEGNQTALPAYQFKVAA
ncbi:DNA cytosine methyltransferase [Nostoc sp. CHAB 5834]|nr:DNA cytosine methyltransferase [Nostoc sp. CHAB 5834]